MNKSIMLLTTIAVLTMLVPNVAAHNRCDVPSNGPGVDVLGGSAGFCTSDHTWLGVEYETGNGVVVRWGECVSDSTCYTLHDDTGIRNDSGAICIVNNGNNVNCFYP